MIDCKKGKHAYAYKEDLLRIRMSELKEARENIFGKIHYDPMSLTFD